MIHEKLNRVFLQAFLQVILPLFWELSKKYKSVNRKGLKGIIERSQRTELHCFNFVSFAITLQVLRLKMIF
jgi:hypothetical protein